MLSLSTLEGQLSQYEEMYDELERHYYVLKYGTSHDTFDERSDVLDDMQYVVDEIKKVVADIEAYQPPTPVS